MATAPQRCPQDPSSRKIRCRIHASSPRARSTGNFPQPHEADDIRHSREQVPHLPHRFFDRHRPIADRKVRRQTFVDRALRPLADTADECNTRHANLAADPPTPTAVFPPRLDPSNRPSPVMTRSAPASRSRSRTASATIAHPPSSRALRNAIIPNPKPPAAPAPPHRRSRTTRDRRQPLQCRIQSIHLPPSPLSAARTPRRPPRPEQRVVHVARYANGPRIHNGATISPIDDMNTFSESPPVSGRPPIPYPSRPSSRTQPHTPAHPIPRRPSRSRQSPG